jgi:hypothetical protein
MMNSTHALRRAFALSPLVALLVFWAGLFALSALQGSDEVSWAAAGHSLFFIGLFGLPVVYAGTLLVGVPLWWLLEVARRQEPPWIIMLSGLAGAAVAMRAWRVIFGDWDSSGVIAGLGGASALAGSVAFVYLAGLRASRPAP